MSKYDGRTLSSIQISNPLCNKSLNAAKADLLRKFWRDGLTAEERAWMNARFEFIGHHLGHKLTGLAMMILNEERDLCADLNARWETFAAETHWFIVGEPEYRRQRAMHGVA